MLSAIDKNLGAIHGRRSVGAQNIDDLGDFIRSAETMHWNLVRYDLLRARGQDRGIDLARSDGIDADTEWTEISCHFARERGQRGFRSGLGGRGEGVHPRSSTRGSVDN